MRTPTRTRQRWGLGAAALALLALGACASGGDNGGDAVRAVPAAEAPADMERRADGADSALTASGAQGEDAGAPTVAVISTGLVSLESDDVARDRAAVQKIVDLHRGSISESETATGEDGEPESARLVLRIPSADFTDVMAELEGVATLLSSSSGSEDVTTQVIDNEVRIRAQEKSLSRIEDLLAQAENLPQVIAIESQLGRRQAELDSLKATQAYLADQTTLSTITVHLERAGDEPGEKDGDDAGFLSGLEDGWHGLVATTVGLLTLIGLVLPFALALALVGVPLWTVLRTQRRRHPAAPADPEPQV